MKRKISLLLAFSLIFPIIASGCNKGQDDDIVIDDNGLIVITEEFGTTAATTMSYKFGEVAPDGSEGETEFVPPEQTGPTLSPEDYIATKATTIESTLDIPQVPVKDAGKYAYNSLSATEKKMYDDMVNATLTLNWRMRQYDDVQPVDWYKVCSTVFNQEAQLFWLSAGMAVGKVTLLVFEPDDIKKMQKEIDAVVEPILKEAATKTTTYDKLKVFHDWLVLNVQFNPDHPLYASIYGAFVLKNAQCSGYAKAIKYLCDRAGIDCMVVTGVTKDGASHAWDIVDINGAWYNLDAMWDDPKYDNPKPDYIRYSYFLVPDKWIHNNTHYEINTMKMKVGTVTYFKPPACTETSQNYFVKNGLMFSDAASAEKSIKEQIDKAVAAKAYAIEVRCDNKQVYDALYKKIKDYQTYATGKSSNVKGLSDSCNAGMLSIHLNIVYK